MNEISKNIIFDKFLCIEGWSYRGKKLCEFGSIELARKAALRMKVDLDELLILLKVGPDDKG